MPAFVVIGLGTVVLYAVWLAWVPLLPSNVYEPLLDLGKITGYTWSSALSYLYLVAAQYVLYALGYRYVLRASVGVWPIFLFGALFGLELVGAYPATAADVFGYAAHGRVLAVYGANPFVVPPGAFPGDSIYPYLAYPDEPSQYGPVWVALNAAIALISGSDLLTEVVLYKVAGLLAHLAGAALVLSIASRLGSDVRRGLAGAYLFLWNPLLLWEMVGNAHNDGLMMLGGLLGLWLLVRRANRLVLPGVALGALVKLPVLVMAPGLLVVTWRRSRGAAVEGLLLGLALAAVWYWPFWQGPRTVTALDRTDLFTASLASLVRFGLEPSVGETIASVAARVVAYGLFGLTLLLILWRAGRASDSRTAIGVVYASLLAALLLATTWFQAWYVVWPFAVGACLPCGARHREVALLGLGGLLQYFVFIYVWVMGVLPDGVTLVQTAAYVAIVGPLLIGWLMARGRPRWPSRTRRPPRPRSGQAVRVTSG